MCFRFINIKINIGLQHHGNICRVLDVRRVQNEKNIMCESVFNHNEWVLERCRKHALMQLFRVNLKLKFIKLLGTNLKSTENRVKINKNANDVGYKIFIHNLSGSMTQCLIDLTGLSHNSHLTQPIFHTLCYRNRTANIQYSSHCIHFCFTLFSFLSVPSGFGSVYMLNSMAAATKCCRIYV